MYVHYVHLVQLNCNIRRHEPVRTHTCWRQKPYGQESHWAGECNNTHVCV